MTRNGTRFVGGTVALEQDETLRLPRGRFGIRARVERGTVIVTQAGDLEDHVLEEGDEVWLPSGGLVVAWAITPAVLAVAEGVAPANDVHPTEHAA
jgi:DUF2917 family protein